ncbi:uncharacterized protein K452DRAFT_318687 [Aplosporella prunicola CBS 121167]|uniref:Uncharacterized protein n=1 Tax=Aplosporella prunicola CBS 121167 TaxID=1176127 RepID=A0A6A6BCF5_9PEZI|nr:uncharacterized protein K452DRAFT_318687 [Aplosporella prunicola CBS 121167]KAF2141736.1 hypothetical protein K452DRAFT_318687 [Aplosporella prunicola CBS 121167]
MPTRATATHDNLRRLPPHAKVQKRPLMRPPINSPYTSRESPKVVYLSTRTPFIAAAKRVRDLLTHAEKRATQSALSQKRQQHQRGDPVMAAALATMERTDEPEEVVVKATGRSIEKAMGLALFFQQQDDCRVQIRTGTADAIDDIVEGPRPVNELEVSEAKEGGVAKSDDDDEELPETRIRHTSVLEVAVTLC